jgi:hypothetical protein
MERRGVRLRRTDGSPDYRAARRGRPEAARRGRRENRSWWWVSRLPFSRQEVTHCEWAGLPRELSTVSHSGQEDSQRDPRLSGESGRAYDLQGLADDRGAVVQAGRSGTWAELHGKIRASSRAAPRHEIHRQRGAARDRFRGFSNADGAEFGLGKSIGYSRRASELTVLPIWAAN